MRSDSYTAFLSRLQHGVWSLELLSFSVWSFACISLYNDFARKSASSILKMPSRTLLFHQFHHPFCLHVVLHPSSEVPVWSGEGASWCISSANLEDRCQKQGRPGHGDMIWHELWHDMTSHHVRSMSSPPAISKNAPVFFASYYISNCLSSDRWGQGAPRRWAGWAGNIS